VNAGANGGRARITAGNTTVRGLVINRFGFDGIRLETAAILSRQLRPVRTAPELLRWVIKTALRSSPLTISWRAYATPGTVLGNVISGNNGAGVAMDQDGNSVLGNIIGLNAAGAAALGNGTDGVLISDGNGSTIGGSNHHCS